MAGELCSFKAVRQVHEVNRHKQKDQLLACYRKAGWLLPELLDTITRVIQDCKICQKFSKSVMRPKIALPKSRSFDEVVTLDLKEFGAKYIHWMIDLFTRFIQGKLITNKKADTIIQALTDLWCMSVGFPSQGFFADNGGEFANIKLEELTSRLALMVRFRPSPWSNGINKRNHASADITIKKLMHKYKTPLTDSLVKAAAWTYNT